MSSFNDNTLVISALVLGEKLFGVSKRVSSIPTTAVLNDLVKITFESYQKNGLYKEK